MVGLTNNMKGKTTVNTTADPCGPKRKITKVETTNSWTLLTLECGHVNRCNPIYSYRNETELKCWNCAQEEVTNLIEWSRANRNVLSGGQWAIIQARLDDGHTNIAEIAALREKLK